MSKVFCILCECTAILYECTARYGPDPSRIKKKQEKKRKERKAKACTHNLEAKQQNRVQGTLQHNNL